MFPIVLKPYLDVASISCKYSLREAKVRKTGYCLGCTSIFFVVFLVSVLICSLQYGPLVLLLILESSEGELDMNVYAGWWTGRSYINLTAAEEILPEYVDRMTPRMNSLLADSWALSDCPNLDAANVMADSSALYLGTDNSNVRYHCSHA